MNPSVCRDILKECAKFAKNEIRPIALDMDLAPDSDRIKSIWDKSRQMELPGLLVPETFDGGGIDLSCAAMVLDCMAGECTGIAAIFAHHFAACAGLATASDGHKERLLPQLADAGGSGIMASLCLPSDLSENRLHLTGDILDGCSAPMGNAELSDGILAFAQTNGNPPEWIALWLDKITSGAFAGKPLSLPGLKAVTFSQLTFEQARLDNLTILARGTNAEKMLAAARKAFYGFVAAMAMGCARTALFQANQYARQRYQSGRIIIEHQEIRRMLGAMQMKLDAGTAACLDLFNEEKLRPTFHAPNAALTKAFCTEAALDILLDAIQIHGGYGYMHEYGLEKRMRDIKVLGAMGEVNPYLQVKYVAGI